MGRFKKAMVRKKAKADKKDLSGKKQILPAGIDEKAKSELQKYIEQEDFETALEVLAGQIQDKKYDGETVYWGAYAYFMLGDYERAAQWIDNALTIDVANIPARILLARICILEDKIKEGMSVYNFVVQNYEGSLTEHEREEITDVLDYYVQFEQEELTDFPILRKFLGVAE